MKVSSADTAFSKAIRARDNFTCQWCGSTTNQMQCSHVFGRRHRTIRWDTLNAKCLCAGCHRKWHESPADAMRWFRGKYGEDRELLLIEKRNQRVKVPRAEEKSIAKHYREQIKLMEADSSHELVSYQ